MSEDRGARRPRGRKPRRKVCAFCVDKIEYIDYKEFRDVNSRMRRNINERGKIMPRRMSGNCAKHQRQLSEAIKRARAIALLPYTAEQEAKRNQAFLARGTLFCRFAFLLFSCKTRGCLKMICTPNTGHPVLGVHIKKASADFHRILFKQNGFFSCFRFLNYYFSFFYLFYAKPRKRYRICFPPQSSIIIKIAIR